MTDTATRPWLRRIVSGLRRRVVPTVQEKSYARWVKDDGDRTLRLDYPLNAGSVVLDVGGYRGDWADAVSRRYGCAVHVFEPVPEFAAAITRRLADRPRIRVHPFGLGATTRRVAMGLSGDASSMLTAADTTGEADVVQAREFLERERLTAVDLVKINIEGAEYELLDHLVAERIVPRLRFLQVQFHPWVPRAAARAESIRRGLAATHRCTWSYPWIWESWERVA